MKRSAHLSLAAGGAWVFALAFAVVTSFTAGTVQASLLAYEGFNYTAGTGLTNASDGFAGDSLGWAGRWTGANVPIATNVDGSLSYSDGNGHTLATNGGSVIVGNLAGSTINAQPSRSFAIGTLSGSVYSGLPGPPAGVTSYWASFIMKWIGYPTPPSVSTSNAFWRKGDIAFRSAAQTNATATGTELVAAGRPNANQFPSPPVDTWTLWSGGDGGAASSGRSTSYPLTGAAFVLLRFDLDGTVALDAAYMWVNWTNLAVEPPTSTANATNTSANLTGLNNIRIDANNQNASGTNTVLQFDEFRLGTSFGDVTPHDTNAVTPTAVVITNTQFSSGGVVLSGTGGPNSGVYRVLASTNLQAALTNWPPVATNAFDVAGNFSLTNAVTTGAAREFFRLLLGGTLPLPPPVAPSITTQPTNVAVAAGQNATFTVGAAGTGPLSFQWYYNTNTLLDGRTNASLALSNVQSNDAGAYSVTVTNIAGSVTSQVATLTILPPTPPTIITQPADLTANNGQTAVFSVVANGTAPFAYQWFFNATNLLASATNASVALTNVQSTNVGGYSVIVTNSLGSATSAVATLTVVTSGTPDFSMVGFATVNGGTTGGAGGATVTVTNKTDLQNALNSNDPTVVQISGVIDLGGAIVIQAKTNKTIVGLGTNAAWIGNIQFKHCTNFIIRNLSFTNVVGNQDGITIQDFCEHFWVDHCTFGDCADGQIDITHGSDFVSVSWCKFNYTTNQTDHRFSSLVGHDDANAAEDEGRLHITYHHDWWSTLATERMPRVRFGGVHVFNTYYNSPGNNYCTLSAIDAQLLIQNNYYQDVDEPWRKETTGRISASGNVFLNVTGTGVPASDTVFAPPYAYAMDPADSVPSIVTNNAGAARGPFAQ